MQTDGPQAQSGAPPGAGAHVLVRLRLAVSGPSDTTMLLELELMLVDEPAVRVPVTSPARPGQPVPGPGAPLTARELSIVRLLPSALSRREIASELFLSLNTVKTHGRSIYRKLGVRSRAQAVVRARELCLVDSDH